MSAAATAIDAHASGGALLELRGITKSFPGVRALDGVDFSLRAGEIHALLGENGAGKSTLINIVTGALRRDGGEMRLSGRAIDPHGAADAERAGIAAVHQEVPLLANLSVAENLLFGRQPTRFGLVRRGETHVRARAMLAQMGLTIDVALQLGSYALPVQQLVAIARAVSLSARVLVLDEPTASLDAAEVETLFRTVRQLAASGVGIVFITHFLDQVYALANRITVLRNGRRVAERASAAFPRDALVTAMLGRELAETEAAARTVPSAATPKAPLVRARGLRNKTLAPFDLDFHAGEVVGASGLLGSGRTETALVLFGAEPAAAGVIEIKGERVRISSPSAAVRAGFGLLPEDRKRDGIFASLSVRENIVIALQARRGWLRPLSRAQQREIADRFINLLAIRTPDAEKPIGQLSGGNQQKALIARWLATEPLLILLDEPTRGVDVGAHADILKLIAELRARGMAVYMISSELDELIAVAERVSVMRDRRQVRMLEGADVNERAILAAIAEAPQS